ncbi:hypothetical protein Xsto_02733 [Xenorhabdus stockiae]|uniref:Uncharacterized protein n=1 Tax=Xenorhabdus stockiae TaxID=351614 RepID=A0A2D0KMT4_9GAMM|nr:MULTISPECIES: hypothetical protein [Xenorhabdus]PHM64716.1 hypothetical protein Xsto_02733 [Xenorhabdus stockiae]PHM70815.1 hypothetical protein Xekj_01624 [Xenorhabdus sp. KJ12.1]
MSTEMKLNIAELPEELRAVIRQGQAVVIRDGGKEIVEVKAYRRSRGKHVPNIVTKLAKLRVKRPIGGLANPEKQLRPIGVLTGKISVPTEEEFARYDREILSMFEGKE